MDSTDDDTTVDAIWERSTAPQSSFTNREALMGFLILLLGVGIVLGVPLVLA